MHTIIPAYFKQKMILTHGEAEAMVWLERLPTILTNCARRWQVTIYPPFSNLSFHYVAPAVRVDGTEVVLKVSSPTGEFAREAEAMRLFAGRGVAHLLATDEEQEVMLLERLRPGAPLAQLVPEQEERATSILASVMRRLWHPAPEPHSFPTVSDLFRGFEQLRTRFAGGSGPFPRRLLEEAETLVAELLATAGPPMLLHGDLHHENVLLSDNEWRVIDAKGVVGDPGYETGLLFYNPLPKIFRVPELPRVLARRIDQLSEELTMERERIRGWGLAQCILSAWWDIEDEEGCQEVPRDVLACAEILANVK